MISLVSILKRFPLTIFALVVLSLPFWFPYIGGYVGLATKMTIWALFALGFDLLLGFTGYLSFGHAIFFGMSAYTTGLMFKHFSAEIIPAMIIAVIVGTLASVAVGYLTMKRSGIYFSILTLAFGEMLHSSALSTFGWFTGGENGLTLPDLRPVLFGIRMDGLTMYFVTAFFLIVGYYIAMRISKSPFGLILRAIKSNSQRLEYTGIDVQKYKLGAFVLSAVYASVAGSLMVVYEPYVGTEYLHWSTSGELVIMSVMGGLGTLIGPIIGAWFMLYFENVLSVPLGEEWLLVLGLIFMAVVIFLPGGFVDGVKKLYNKLTKNSADVEGK
ncbi:MAG: branched-chain amino acid ABC transporter permease [Rhizobiales bacterium]|nr:branched-chain amino acid ABC transporter permease [Hyphomicrobiales bacterium]NRB14888.1 branched-chain amino acid ABC transporter permease [Hyphomicrobiales bacterium]